jgi:hypothetical protein
MREESSRTHDVFLSYSSKDKAWADAACAVLERHRVRCWIAPRDITPGEEWGAAIMKGLNGSRIIVLIFSDHANASEQVRREVERAISQGMTVLPVRVEDVRPEGTMEYALGNRHWLDAFTPPVEQQLEKLARSVKTLLDHEPETTPGGEPPITGMNPQTRRPPWVWPSVVVGVLMLGLLAVWLGGVFKAKTPDGVIGLESVPMDKPPVSPTAKPVEASTRRTVVKLAVPTEGVRTPLFNRKDLSGWTFPMGSRSDWSVEGGVLTYSAEGGMIATSKRDYADFRIRVELQVPNHRHNVIGIRSSFDHNNPDKFVSYNFNMGGLLIGNNTIAPLGSYVFQRVRFLKDGKGLKGMGGT